MIISNDSKIFLIGVPKTGTRTAKNIIEPYGVFLKEHATYSDLVISANQKVPDFHYSKIEKIYVFWRDPVERFISSVNHFRSPKHILHLIRHKPQWFSGIDLSAYTDLYNKLPTPEMAPFPPVPQTVIDECLIAAASITPEQIFNDSSLMHSHLITRKQISWYKFLPEEKLVVLDFAKFEENLRTVANDFGAPSDITIPKLNESRKLTTSLSSELEDAVKEYYAEDYALKPT